ncbi:MAG: GNAT family N-acetyltransferase [Paraclostridium sordellii]
MHIENDKFYLTKITIKDYEEIIKIYNSNEQFLNIHQDTKSITTDWLDKEMKTMKKEGFLSYKIVEKTSNQIIGIIDFKISNQSYISLIIIHRNHQNKGLGKEVYNLIENYLKQRNSLSIKIDVVKNYNKNVINFWLENGFEIIEEISLNWNGKVLNALTMEKII